MQPSLVTVIANRVAPGGHVYLSSDVHEVAVDMWMRFEEHAGASLQISALHKQLPTFVESGEHLPVVRMATAAVTTSADAAADVTLQHQRAVPPLSAAWQWLPDNPTGLVTEREQSVLRQGLPMYRMLLSRTA